MCSDIRRNRCPDTAAQTRFNLHGADGQTSKRKLNESIFHQDFFSVSFRHSSGDGRWPESTANYRRAFLDESDTA